MARRFAIACLSLGQILAFGLGLARADSIGLYTTRTSFDDVVFELDAAIVARGLSVHSSGNKFADMLERTGPAVGSTKPVYRKATFTEVCSAKHARAMVEADPTLMANCPFTFFVYEHVDTPGVVTVGFRRLASGTTAAAKQAVALTESLLDGIARDAAK